MNPLAPPCLSLSEYALEAAQDKASAKRKGVVHLHPLGSDFAPPKTYITLFSVILHFPAAD